MEDSLLLKRFKKFPAVMYKHRNKKGYLTLFPISVKNKMEELKQPIKIHIESLRSSGRFNLRLDSNLESITRESKLSKRIIIRLNQIQHSQLIHTFQVKNYWHQEVFRKIRKINLKRIRIIRYIIIEGLQGIQSMVSPFLISN